MLLRRSPPVSVMIHPSSNAISVMNPRVLRLAVLAIWMLSARRSANVSAGRFSGGWDEDVRDRRPRASRLLEFGHEACDVIGGDLGDP
jgi:hypothetical protein